MSTYFSGPTNSALSEPVSSPPIYLPPDRGIPNPEAGPVRPDLPRPIIPSWSTHRPRIGLGNRPDLPRPIPTGQRTDLPRPQFPSSDSFSNVAGNRPDLQRPIPKGQGMQNVTGGPSMPPNSSGMQNVTGGPSMPPGNSQGMQSMDGGPLQGGNPFQQLLQNPQVLFQILSQLQGGNGLGGFGGGFGGFR